MSERKLPVVGAMDRRTALRVMAVAAAVPGVASCGPDTGQEASAPAPDTVPAPAPSTPGRPALVAGTPTDPYLRDPVVPWARVLAGDELDTLSSLCDVIIPRDERSPGAGELGAQDFIDEWIGAPWEANRRDRVLIRGGIAWLDREAARRHGEGTRFSELTQVQKWAICEDIHDVGTAGVGFGAAARFFDRVRDLTATAFWTTEEGMRDIGYVGNTPQASWGPPPPEVLRRLGLEP